VLKLTLQALKVAAIATVALLTLFFSQRVFDHYLNRSATADTNPVLFTIAPDESTDSVAARLHDLKLIQSPLYFKAKLRLRGTDTKLQPGPHNLREGMSVDEVIDSITVVFASRPGTPTIVAYVQFRTQEGWRTEQIAQLLLDKGLIKNKDEFYNALNDPSLTEEFDFLAGRPNGAKLDGYLFPDTYSVPLGTPVKQIIEQMLLDFDTRVPRNMRDQLPQGYTFYQVLTVASIIEREAAVDSERATIASVYYNRLRQNPPMPLQADPTVQYVVGTDTDWWPMLQAGDLKRESSYNTYLHSGLPPGPICNPSLKSIVAALNPAQTDYLYFVAKGDGTHAFARTYEEHQANIQKYQQR
jgi:UPF0755 protein